jgi:hypothetical protein
MTGLRRDDGRVRNSARHSALRFRVLPVVLLVVGSVPAPHPAFVPGGATGQITGAAPGSVTGRVVDESGRPVPDARVTFDFFSGGEESRRLEVTSKDDGSFTCDAPGRGRFGISVTATGYVFVEARPTYRLGEDVTLRVEKGGVITGTVTGPEGAPVIGVEVRTESVRDGAGNASVLSHAEWPHSGSALTDDRGTYRIYGLDAGAYLVAVGGPRPDSDPEDEPGVYDRDVTTYYPSASRSGGKEVAVRRGEEIVGIDIKYRARRGHRVAGSLRLAVESALTSVRVSLRALPDGTVERDEMFLDLGDLDFAFVGLGDGTYEIVAQQVAVNGGDVVAVSAPRRVAVRGADVKGIEVTLPSFPEFATISGKVVVESDGNAKLPDSCPSSAAAKGALRVSLWADLAPKGGPPTRHSTEQPEASGEFAMLGIKGGRYRMGVDYSDDGFYTVAIELATVRPRKDLDVARAGLDLRPGARVGGLTIRIAWGAASVAGRVSHATGGAALPDEVRVLLVPDDGDDVVHFAEARVTEGSFALGNLAPGAYRILTLEPADRGARLVAWDEAKRRALAAAARERGTKLELAPCESVANLALVFDPDATSEIKP